MIEKFKFIIFHKEVKNVKDGVIKVLEKESRQKETATWKDKLQKAGKKVPKWQEMERL